MSHLHVRILDPRVQILVKVRITHFYGNIVSEIQVAIQNFL